MLRTTQLLFISALGLLACQISKHKQLEYTKSAFANTTESYQSTQIEGEQINANRLKHIRLLHNTYPEIKLPFHYKTQTSFKVTQFNANNEIDSLVFGNDVPCGIIGVIPDTSVFFGFFYLIAADDATPALVVYDKKGNLIEKKTLSRSCWQGCESDCRSIIDIDKLYTITFRYEEYEFDFKEDYSYCAETPNQASGYIEYSHIDSAGKVVIDKVDLLTLEELMKNPIIHDE